MPGILTVKARAGPSFQARVDAALKGINAKTHALESEQRKALQAAVEKGRSRPTSAPVRPNRLSPNQQAMLQDRIKKMKEQDEAYKKQMADMRKKMNEREPLFRLSDVQAGFEMLRLQQEERRRELQHEEHERWAHLRNVEESAFQRPLLIEDFNYRPPRSACHPALKAAEKDFDERIKAAIGGRWFQESDWGRKLKEMKEKVDTRQKLHEIEYPQKCDFWGSSSSSFLWRRLIHVRSFTSALNAANPFPDQDKPQERATAQVGNASNPQRQTPTERPPGWWTTVLRQNLFTGEHEKELTAEHLHCTRAALTRHLLAVRGFVYTVNLNKELEAKAKELQQLQREVAKRRQDEKRWRETANTNRVNKRTELKRKAEEGGDDEEATPELVALEGVLPVRGKAKAAARHPAGKANVTHVTRVTRCSQAAQDPADALACRQHAKDSRVRCSSHPGPRLVQRLHVLVAFGQDGGPWWLRFRAKVRMRFHMIPHVPMS
ncbi:hypothetical protein AK812_SmicGene21263 [Symbiodinium microadriaticum]|uniref:Uncharacterized protein n=1 Tax=Symbiodinium microadriaticum TaxID=2951 RepID=A0A1Q9DMT6_SYMMI|nr:hypothetical protein AK812_SmicGene21263 [Symbiodinium microadriaticum]